VHRSKRDYVRLSDARLLAAVDPDAFAVVTAMWRICSRGRVRVLAITRRLLTAEVFARACFDGARFVTGADGLAFPRLFGIAQTVFRDSLRKRRVEDRARARLALRRLIAPDLLTFGL